MSRDRNVDTRVVKMEFDNAQFERKVKQTQKSLKELDQSLSFQDSDKGFKKLKLSVSAMEVAVTTAIASISNKIVNLGTTLIKALSVDNITAGWVKFGEKTTSVATMVAQKIRIAGKEIEDQGEKLNVVNEQLEKLAWFSDETSYSFTDMVNNISKFTAAGQDLDKSVKAMEGIATWAALSGQNSQTASRAMYQLAQAMGKGKIQKIDWMSIQNANMDTEEFREKILETAVAMGELTKEGDKFVTKTGKKFEQSQFAEFLSEGWFTSDVLVKGLNKYSSAIDEIYRIAEEEGMTASEVIEQFGDQLDEFGVKAFKTAQEARTFTDVINSIKDAVSSKWMETFENIFGGKDDAVKLWTDLANELYEVFAESGNFRNNVLKTWNSLGGRGDLFAKDPNHPEKQGAFWNLYDAVTSFVKLIKSTWNTVFPLSTMEDENDQAYEIGSTLKRITSNLRSWTEAVRNNTEWADRFGKILKFAFNVLKAGLNILKAVRFILDPVIQLAKTLVGQILDRLIYYMEKFNSDGSRLESIAIKLRNALAKVIETIKIEKLLDGLFVIIDWIVNLVSKIPSLLMKLKPVFTVVVKAVKEVIKWLLKIPEALNNISIKLTGRGIIDNISFVFNKIISLFEKFTKKEEQIVTKATNKAKAPLRAAKINSNDPDSVKAEDAGPFAPIVIFLKGLSTFVKGVATLVSGLMAGLGKVLNVIGKILTGIGNSLIKVFNRQKLETTNDRLWATVAILGVTAIILGLLLSALKNLAWSFSSLFSPLGVIADAISTFADAKYMDAISSMINSITSGLLKVVIALAILGGLNWDGAIKGIILLVAFAATLGALMFLLLKNTSSTVTVTRKWVANATSLGNIFKNGVSNIFKSITGAIDDQRQINRMWSVVGFVSTFTTGMLKLAVAMRVIEKVSWEGFAKSMIAMGSMMLGIIAISKICSNGVVDIKKAYPGLFAMIGIAIFMKTFGKTIISLEGIDWAKSWPALIAMSLALSALLGVIWILSKGRSKDAASGFSTLLMLIGVATVMKVFARSIKQLANINIASMIVATTGMLAFMGVFTGLILVLSKINSDRMKVVKEALKAMASVSVALLVFAVAVKALSTVSWEGLAKSMVAITSLFTIITAFSLILSNFAGGTNFATTMMSIGTAIMMITTALIPFTATMMMMSLIGWKGLAIGLAGIAGGFAVLAVAAIVIKPLIGVIVALSAAILTIGVGTLIAGLGLQALAIGILALGAAAVPTFGAITAAFAAWGPEFMESLGASFGSFFAGLLEGFTQLLPAVIQCVTTILSSILDLLVNFIPRIITPVIETLALLLTKLADAADEIAEAVTRIIVAVLKAINNHSPEIFKEIFGILTKMLHELRLKIGDIVKELGGILLNGLVALIEWLTPKIPMIIDLLLNFGAKVLVILTGKIIALAALVLKVLLILTAASLALLIHSLGTLGSLFVQFVGAVLLLLTKIVIGMADVIYELLKTIIYNVLNLLCKVIRDSGEIIVRSLSAVLANLIVGLFKAILAIPVVGDIIRTIMGWFGVDVNKLQDQMDAWADSMFDSAVLAGQNVTNAANQAGKNIMNSIGAITDGIGDTLQQGMAGINDTVSQATGALGQAMGDFTEDLGEDFIGGFVGAIDEGTNYVAGAASDAAQAGVDATAETLDINSPSKVMMRLGDFMMQGLANGIQNGKDKVFEVMKNTLDSAITMSQDIVEDEDGDDITLVVGLDTSQVKSQAADIREIMSGISNPSMSLYGQNADYAARTRSNSSSDETIGTTTDKSTKVTYNNTFNISSTDPEESAEEIDKKLKEQAVRAKYARGGI